LGEKVCPVQVHRYASLRSGSHSNEYTPFATFTLFAPSTQLFIVLNR
jgi:hypothetical protein